VSPPLALKAQPRFPAQSQLKTLTRFETAFYVEYQYYHRKTMAREGLPVEARVPGVFSSKVQQAGLTGVQSYGTVPVNQAGFAAGPGRY